MVNVAKVLTKEYVKDKKLQRKIANRESKRKYLPEKGKYKIAKSQAKNTLKQPVLDYKIKKRKVYARTAVATEGAGSYAQAQQEETKRQQAQYARDASLTQWASAMTGNPDGYSTTGTSGNKQNKSTTSITAEAYTIPKG